MAAPSADSISGQGGAQRRAARPRVSAGCARAGLVCVHECSDVSARQHKIAMEGVPLPSWSVHDVATWLESLELSEHKSSFLQSSIDGSLLQALGPSDLSELGVTNKFHARKIISRRDKVLQIQAAGHPQEGHTEARISIYDAEERAEASPSYSYNLNAIQFVIVRAGCSFCSQR